jgi:inhibitor of KinA
MEPLGDAAIMIRWMDGSEEDWIDRKQQLVETFRLMKPLGFIEAVPGYSSVAIHYDATRLTYAEALAQAESMLNVRAASSNSTRSILDIPVCYDVTLAWDLVEVADRLNRSVDDVVRLHTAGIYRVQMIGFSPGFPYLSGLSESLIVPRRATPRLKVPAGSVAIGGKQTGIYSIETPGGWNIMGRTPMSMFLPTNDPPSRLAMGDRVRFVPISLAEYFEQGGVS